MHLGDFDQQPAVFFADAWRFYASKLWSVPDWCIQVYELNNPTLFFFSKTTDSAWLRYPEVCCRHVHHGFKTPHHSLFCIFEKIDCPLQMKTTPTVHWADITFFAQFSFIPHYCTTANSIVVLLECDGVLTTPSVKMHIVMSRADATVCSAALVCYTMRQHCSARALLCINIAAACSLGDTYSLLKCIYAGSTLWGLLQIQLATRYILNASTVCAHCWCTWCADKTEGTQTKSHASTTTTVL